jgi:hypothetical protein
MGTERPISPGLPRCGLQHSLHHLNSSRNQKSYKLTDVLKDKMTFLRSITATRTLTTTGSPVPKVVLQSFVPMDVDDVGVQQEDCEDAMSENAVGDKSDDVRERRQVHRTRPCFHLRFSPAPFDTWI